jgi:hypothetical protein
MNRTHPPAPTTHRNAALRHFVRHFLEMVVAMVVGMVALGPVWSTLFDVLGRSALLHRPEPMALVMATDMTIVMAAWMRYRGHGWMSTVEMSAAMYVPFVVLFVPLWMGLLSANGLMVAGHVLMLPAMVVAMLLRRDEYACGHGGARR